MAEQQPQLSRRDARREFNERVYGTNIPNVKQKEAYAQSVASAEKKGAALKAGFTPPTAAATGDLLKRRLELFKGMQEMGREKAAELSVEAEGLGISKSGFRQALNRIPLTPSATDTTPATTATTPATTATTPAATRPAAPEPISKIGGVPASEALAALRERATAAASKITDPAQREAAMPFGPTSAERYTSAQVMRDKLATEKRNAEIAGSTLPAISTSGLRPLAPVTPVTPVAPVAPVAPTPTPTPVAATPTPAPTPKPALARLADTTNAMADVARARINKPYTERNVEGFTSFDEMGRNVVKAGSDAANYTKNLLRSLRALPEKTNAATERFRRSLNN